MQTIFTNCTLYPEAYSEIKKESYLVTKEDTITETGSMTSVPDVRGATVIDCGGKLLMPGLINGHNHCAMTLFRGLADDLELSSWLHDHIFPAEAAHVSREMAYWCTRLAAAEMILSGTTCVADGYFFSGDAARALSDCGMRAVVAHGIVDFPAPSVPDPKKNIETVARFIEQWQGADPLITPALFAHAPYTCSPHTLTRAKELADDRGVRFFTHIAESRGELEMIIEKQADSPIKHLSALHLLDPNSTLIHAIWAEDADLETLAESGAHVVSCPQSNLKLASGVARIADMIKHNIKVGLGTDGCASNNGLDMFREMSTFAKLHKMVSGEATTLPAQQVLQAATTTNCSALGLKNLGRLRAGCKADLIVLDINRPHLTPFYNPDLLVYAAGGGDVHSTMINGRLVMQDRKILSFDLDETISKVRETAAQIGATCPPPPCTTPSHIAHKNTLFSLHISRVETAR